MILCMVIFSCSVLKLEMPRSQTQLLLHLKEPLVVSLAFYHFGTNGGQLKKSPCIMIGQQRNKRAISTSVQ